MKKNPDLVAFGRNVAALRKDNSLTQEDLAERSELDATPFKLVFNFGTPALAHYFHLIFFSIS